MSIELRLGRRENNFYVIAREQSEKALRNMNVSLKKRRNVQSERKTRQRSAISRVFLRHDRPMGIEEILSHGRKIVESLNQATVYRNLKAMVESGWLRQFSHPSLGTLYELADKEHHHHFYCCKCNKIYELPGCALNQEKAVPKGFVLQEHEIFLSGLCPNCAADRHNP
jgi:Fur family ferric uptake transcriptional regulator